MAPSQDILQGGVRLYQEGKFAEAQQRFESILQKNPTHALALWHLGCTLHRQKNYAGAIATLERARTERPASAEVHFALGSALIATSQAEPAAASFQRAVELKPDWAQAWSHLGHAQGAMRRYDEAEATLRHALTFPTYRADTLNHLGVISTARGRPTDAIEFHLEAIKCNPRFFQSWSNLGNALRALNQLDEALVAYRQSLAIEPKNAFVKFNIAIVHLLQGKLTPDAWLKYEYRWVTLNSNPQRDFTQPLWRGEESLAGKSILLYAEQGLGDTINFIRYAATLAALGATVHVEVQRPLKEILRSTPGCASIIGWGEPLPPFDFHCPLLSVPLALRTSLETIPAPYAYLAAPPDRAAKWTAQLGAKGKFRVGFVWRGNPKHANDLNRSIALEQFRGVFAATDCEFVSLQVGPNETESATLAAHANVTDPTSQIADFSDTAALIAQLDLVLAVDTSVAHLAAALGKPTWVLLPFSPDWRWLLDRDDSPWYPTVRLFRQPALGEWDPVLDVVTRELAAAAAGQRAAA
jgi:tetratricopeptide (TPR) repeat protein